MRTPLSVIVIEDSLEEVKRIEAALTSEGISCHCQQVNTPADLVAALVYEDVSIVLSHYPHPAFEGISALKTTKDKRPDVPFVFLSTAFDEESTVEMLKSGATDCVLKPCLCMLALVVRRAVAETEGRNARKQLETMLVEAGKMEVVGRLTAGIAHDFNNLLAVINGYSDLLLEKIPETDPVSRDVRQISLAGDRAAKLTRELLDFTRRHGGHQKAVKLNSIVADVEMLVRHLVGEKVRLITKLDPRVASIMADPTLIEQVIMNLAANARDAMPGGGILQIACCADNLQEEAASAAGVMPGHHAVLTVTDTGSGMDESTKARMFEPFFTTKEAGKGTGLGLWSAFEIVEQLGGGIIVESEPGRGTTFRIYFPMITCGEALSTRQTNDLEVRKCGDGPRRKQRELRPPVLARSPGSSEYTILPGHRPPASSQKA